MALLVGRIRLAIRKAAPKPSYGARPRAAVPPPRGDQLQQAQAPPLPSVPPPASGGYSAGGQDASAQSGGGFGRQLLMIGASIIGTVLAFRLVSSIFGPRRIAVIHKDQHGNVISR
eukprot:CAMPEP_0172868728 /NCGR_PEP_ID=MMETSP1075-20121228/87092_1 /TAXON_ID=2916 /ORGANISM="Ceratium fusus, Strain PA161109" /LENGTH=115 /DNA_ID=CAMNT_0013718433 /DNA_START=24 /DNA_END=374 /DNA_ORIENTATION=+